MKGFCKGPEHHELAQLADEIFETEDLDEAAARMERDGLVMLGIAKGADGRRKYLLAHCTMDRAELALRDRLRSSPAQAGPGADAAKGTETSAPAARPAP